MRSQKLINQNHEQIGSNINRPRKGLVGFSFALFIEIHWKQVGRHSQSLKACKKLETWAIKSMTKLYISENVNNFHP